MTTTTDVRPATVLQILKLYRKGNMRPVIAHAAGVTDDQVAEITRAHGAPDIAKLDAAIRDLERDLASTPTPKPSTRRSTTTEQTKRAATIDDLIDDAKATGNDDLVRVATRVETHVAKLREAFDVHRSRADQLAEVERLRRETAKACARAGVPDKDGDKIVRAWAKRKGMDVSARGVLAKKVRDAYVAAHIKGGGTDG